MGKSPACREDIQAAKAAVYHYVNNPFIKGSRRARMFDKFKIHYDAMDAEITEMETIYGSFGIKRKLVNNIPRTFYERT